ncbi:MAG: ABC transporter substrate-binding protein [Gordonia sp. (in: high G+C Gram-positive bacteria)]
MRRAGVAGLLLGIVAALACSLVACSARSDEAAVGPVQINMPDGRSVNIPDTPTRIVTLGGQWTDVLLAFGEKPVGYYDANFAARNITAPWYGNKLSGVVALDPNDDVVANVAKLDPDLILAPGFAGMSGVFDKLARLAPTLDQISGQQIDPWEDMVTLMGTILRRTDKAAEIIDGVTAKITGIMREYPGLRGKTYAFAYMYGADQIQALGDTDDGAGEVFSSLGLTLAPRLVQQAQTTGQPRFGLSAENLPWLNADLLVMAAENDQLGRRLQGLPGYRNLRSVRSGAVALLDVTAINGLNEPGPLALPYSLDQITPALARAAGA